MRYIITVTLLYKIQTISTQLFNVQVSNYFCLSVQCRFLPDKLDLYYIILVVCAYNVSLIHRYTPAGGGAGLVSEWHCARSEIESSTLPKGLECAEMLTDILLCTIKKKHNSHCKRVYTIIFSISEFSCRDSACIKSSNYLSCNGQQGCHWQG